jgi:hypothetical protein
MKLIRHYLNSTAQGYSPRSRLAFYLVPRSKNASVSATQIGTPVLPTHQNKVRHCRGNHSKLSSPITPSSSGRAGLPNNPRHQEVSSSKLAGNRHPLGWRHLGTLGPHHLGCFLRHDFSKNRRRPGGHQPTRMEQRLKSAPLDTFGTRMFRLTGHAPPCNRR